MNTPDQEFDRLMKLLDVGITAAKSDDWDTALMAAKEAERTARRLPQKAIFLPDRSNETTKSI